MYSSWESPLVTKLNPATDQLYHLIMYVCMYVCMCVRTGLGPDSAKNKEYLDTDTLKKSKEYSIFDSENKNQRMKIDSIVCR